MESISLEIKVMFGKDLKAFNFFQKLSLYVQVSIVSDDTGKKLRQKQQHRTPADKEGEGNPEWNHEMRFDLKEIPFHDCDLIFIQFELRHEGVIFGDKTIGEVRVPIKDLLSEFNGVVRFVDYEVRTADGKPNGVLTFSYKVNIKNSVLETSYYHPCSEIAGYSIAHNPLLQVSQNHYPILDVHSSSAEVNYPSHWSQPQVNYPVPSSSSSVLYPPPELPTTTQQDVQYLSPGMPHPPQESYYPSADAYYPLPPPMPSIFPHPPPPPPPPPLTDSAYYPSPRPSEYGPWAPGPYMGYQTYRMPATWGHSYEDGETSPNGYPHGRYHHSSSWNGR